MDGAGIIRSMNINKSLVITAVVLLLFVDFLAFHDILEPHTIRDWLTFVASGMTAALGARMFLRKTR